MLRCFHAHILFFFNDTATTEIYTLSLHDALPISIRSQDPWDERLCFCHQQACFHKQSRDRKSTRLNSSHQIISYAVFCLTKKISDGDSGENERLPTIDYVPQQKFIHAFHYRCVRD